MVPPPRLERGTSRSTIKGDRLSAADKLRHKIVAKPRNVLAFLQRPTTLDDRVRQAQTGASAYLWRIPLESHRHGEPVGLTVLKLKALEPRDKPYEVRDPAIIGGYVVVWPTRALSYVLRFRFQNASKKATIGRFGPVANGLAEIRAKAREAQNQLTAARKPAADALDPAAAKKAARLAATQAVQKERADFEGGQGAAARRLAKIVETYLATHGRNLRASTRKEIARLFAKELGAWKERRLSEIETADVHAVFDAITARGSEITANRLHSYLRHLFVWAKGRKMIAASPLDGVSKPTSEKNRARSRASTTPNWPSFGKALQRSVFHSDHFFTLPFCLALVAMNSVE